jgi:hypothetical protein
MRMLVSSFLRLVVRPEHGFPLRFTLAEAPEVLHEDAILREVSGEGWASS